LIDISEECEGNFGGGSKIGDAAAAMNQRQDEGSQTTIAN